MRWVSPVQGIERNLRYGKYLHTFGGSLNLAMLINRVKPVVNTHTHKTVFISEYSKFNGISSEVKGKPLIKLVGVPGIICFILKWF